MGVIERTLNLWTDFLEWVTHRLSPIGQMVVGLVLTLALLAAPAGLALWAFLAATGD